MRSDKYPFEHLLLAATMLFSILGFSTVYLGQNAAPNGYHHLHAATVSTWLILLLFQLRMIASKRHGDHRRAGLAVLGLGPLLFAASALLTVHSAQKGLASGKGDALIVQNVITTIELGSLILLAFVLRRRRKLHGAFLMSTAILFMGIALFFTVVGFLPKFVTLEQTFDIFQFAGMTLSITCAVVGLLLFAKDIRNGWPFLVAGFSFIMMELVRSSLTKNGLIVPLTEFVGSMNQAVAFVGCFALMFAALAATGVFKAGGRRGLASVGTVGTPALD